MGRGGNNTILFIGVTLLATGCNLPTPNRDQPSALQADTVVTNDAGTDSPVNNNAGDTIKFQDSAAPALPQALKNPSAFARVLNEADKQYIDWIIPDYPDVILLHESSAETLHYTEEIYRYLRSKNASVRKKIITQKHTGKAGDKRLYIDDVGENWYEVFVFDEWK